MKLRKKKNINQQFDSKKMLLTSNSSFPVQEAFKTLRTNVMFSLPEAGCKVIGVTSANRSEGKSMVSLNLAISFAQMNKRVLVIDCDLRIPTIASKLNISNSVGLSNYLARTESDNVLRIYHYGTPTIDVVTAGSIPPDPTALLGSAMMKAMLESLREDYDYIILDFPPAFLVSDAAILSDSVDGYLLVVRQNSSEYSKINEAIRQMDFVNAKLIGFVYNAKIQEGMISKDSKYYKYYYKRKSKK